MGWPTGPPARIIEHLLIGDFYLLSSSDLLDELARVLEYPKLAKHFEDPATILELTRSIATIVEPTTTVNLLEDEPDNRFLEVALEAGADYIVTGDRGLLDLGSFEGTEIIRPASFLSVLEG